MEAGPYVELERRVERWLPKAQETEEGTGPSPAFARADRAIPEGAHRRGGSVRPPVGQAGVRDLGARWRRLDTSRNAAGTSSDDPQRVSTRATPGSEKRSKPLNGLGPGGSPPGAPFFEPSRPTRQSNRGAPGSSSTAPMPPRAFRAELAHEGAAGGARRSAVAPVARLHVGQRQATAPQPGTRLARGDRTGHGRAASRGGLELPHERGREVAGLPTLAALRTAPRRTEPAAPGPGSGSRRPHGSQSRGRPPARGAPTGSARHSTANVSWSPTVTRP